MLKTKDKEEEKVEKKKFNRLKNYSEDEESDPLDDESDEEEPKKMKNLKKNYDPEEVEQDDDDIEDLF